MNPRDHNSARALRKISDLDVHRGRRIEPRARDNPAEREERILAHIKRIRSDPRWRGESDSGRLHADAARAIRRKYQAAWLGLNRKRRIKLQNELARDYRVRKQVIYRVLSGKQWRDL